jgi:hypothetical protein
MPTAPERVGSKPTVVSPTSEAADLAAEEAERSDARAGRSASSAIPKLSESTAHYEHAADVPIKPGQTLAFAAERGYYAAGRPNPTKAPTTPTSSTTKITALSTRASTESPLREHVETRDGRTTIRLSHATTPAGDKTSQERQVSAHANERSAKPSKDATHRTDVKTKKASSRVHEQLEGTRNRARDVKRSNGVHHLDTRSDGVSEAHRILINLGLNSNYLGVTLGNAPFHTNDSAKQPKVPVSITVVQHPGHESVTIRVGKESATVSLFKEEREQVEKLRKTPIPITDPKTGVVTERYIRNPLFTVLAAKIARIPLSLACALITQESYGGLDIWGGDEGTHDGMKAIFTFGGKYTNSKNELVSPVTKQAYDAYRTARGNPGRKGNALREQGVGPTMLTYANVQDDADDLGGAWRPLPNMIVGFSELHQLIKGAGNDLALGVQRYNASSAQEPGAYATGVLDYQAQWKAVVGTAS